MLYAHIGCSRIRMHILAGHSFTIIGNEEITAYVVDDKGCKRPVSWQGSIYKKMFAAMADQAPFYAELHSSRRLKLTRILAGQHDDMFAAMTSLIALYLIRLEPCNIKLGFGADNVVKPPSWRIVLRDWDDLGALWSCSLIRHCSYVEPSRDDGLED
ncbi:hypothetical protein Tco_0617187 [Tanacetum coccineum]